MNAIKRVFETIRRGLLLLRPTKSSLTPLVVLFASLLTAQGAYAACSGWQGRAFLNEYFFGTPSSSNYIEIYSADLAFASSWQGWSVDVYTGSNTKTNYPLATGTSGVSACGQSGKTWVRAVVPSGLSGINGVLILKDSSGNPVDVLVFDKKAPPDIWTDNYTNWTSTTVSPTLSGLAASCLALADSVTSQAALAVSSPANFSNVYVWASQGNKDYQRMSDGGIDGVGNPWYNSTSTGAGTTYSSCSSNNANLTKTTPNMSVPAGGVATFVLNFVGTGSPGAGSSVTITDAVPIALTNVTAVPSLNSGTATIGTPTLTATPVTWTFTVPATGVTATLTITAIVPPTAAVGTAYTNTTQTTGLSPMQSDLATVVVSSPTSPSFVVTASSSSACVNNPVNITVTAMSGPNGTGSQYAYTGTITLLASSAQGTLSKVSGGGAFTAVAGAGYAFYTFVAGDNGQAVFSLTETATQTTTLSAFDSVTNIPSGSSGPITFGSTTLVDTDVVSPLYTPMAGRPHKLLAGACGATGNKATTLWYTPTASNPLTAAAPKISTSPACASPVTLSSTQPSTSTITLNYPATIYLCTSDIGQYAINLATSATAMTAANFTVRPFALAVSAIKQGTTNNPADNTASGSVFAKAGSNFQASVGAYLWNSAADTLINATGVANTNGDGIPDTGATLAQIAASGTAPSYGWTTLLSATSPYTPAAGTLGTLNNGTLAFSGGQATPATLNYTEVGSFSMKGTATNFLNGGVNLTALVFDNSATPQRNSLVGRFTPDHFDTAVTLVSGVPMACASGVTCPSSYNGMVYSGQPFSLNVYAKNAAGATTLNYDGALGYSKQATLSAASTIGGSLSAVGSITAGATVPASSFKAGGTLLGTPAQPAFSFTTTPTVPSAIYLRAVDTDNVTTVLAVPANSLESGVEVVSGRLKVSSVYGSELLPLTLTATAQYYNTAGSWIASMTDSASSFNTKLVSASGNLVTSNLTGNLLVGDINVLGAGAVTLLGGSKDFTLGKPNKTGSVDICFNAPAYLLPCVAGRATFGIYKGNNNLIYQREAY